jgi:hypothetical protein
MIKQILDEIADFCTVFTSVSFVFAHREANQAARYCAKYAAI